MINTEEFQKIIN